MRFAAGFAVGALTLAAVTLRYLLRRLDVDLAGRLL